MNEQIHCLSRSPCTHPCGLNGHGECRAVCSVILFSSVCNQTVDCYWNNGQCQAMDSDYCTTTMAQSSIKACRKDGNDYCYYQNEQCLVCNENSTFKNLISMNGRQCLDRELYTCAPYFQQGNHAACRKYCEFNQKANHASATCEYCQPDEIVFDNTCISIEECVQSKFQQNNTLLQYSIAPAADVYGQYIGLSIAENSHIKICGAVKNNHDVGLLLEEERYTTSCSPGYFLREYHECDREQGESAEMITAVTEQYLPTPQQRYLITGTCAKCKAGSYINAENKCVQCPKGQTSFEENSLVCIECPTGMQAVDADGLCVEKCAAGQIYDDATGRCHSCDPGQEVVDNVCVDCRRSYYLSDASLKCVRCSNGRTTRNTASNSEFDCNIECREKDHVITYFGDCAHSCGPGTIIEAKSAKYCTACQSGHELIDGVCTMCQRSYYKKEGQITCTPCVAGTTTEGRGATHENECSIKCLADQFVDSNGECVGVCGPHQYKNISTKRCTECDSGTFVDHSGLKCVSQCSPGYYPDALMLMCQLCPALTISTDGTHCAKCPVGQISDELRLNCDTCKYGEYIDLSTGQCTPCSTEDQPFISPEYDGCTDRCLPGDGLNGLNACEPCQPGYFSDETTNNQCIRCPPQTYSTSGSKACLACGPRQYSFAGADSCHQCSDDQYVNSSGDGCTKGLACDPGYGPDEKYVCTVCLAGTGSDGTMPCQPCDQDEYADRDGQQCMPCANGKATEDRTGCKTGCRAGQYYQLLDGISGTGRCVDCPAGHYSVEGGICYPCPPMKYAPTAGTSECLLCPTSSFSTAGATECTACLGDAPMIDVDQKKCVSQCSENSYYVPGNPQCIRCPPGQHSAKASTTCQNCPAMEYSISGGSCQPCARGAYSASGDAVCTICPENMYVNVQRNGCVTFCSAGTYINEEARRCEQCPGGSISRPNQNKCALCKPMTYAKPGDTQCRPCRAGSFSTEGQQECTQCHGAAPLVNLQRNGCTSTCEGGSHPNYAEKQCQRCEPGTYSDGALQCMHCPENNEPSEWQDACVECKYGTYSHGASSQCVACQYPSPYLSYDRRECRKACGVNQEPLEIDGNYQCFPCQGLMESWYGLECAYIQRNDEQNNMLALAYIIPSIAGIIALILMIVLCVLIKKARRTNLLLNYNYRRIVCIRQNGGDEVIRMSAAVENRPI